MLRYMMAGVVLVLGFSAINPAVAQQDTSHTSQSENNAAKLSESQKVQQLIDWIRNLKGATFIRNGSAYDSQKAADHLQAKWEKHQDEVKTAKGFIEELASKSGTSGKDYLIRFADGKTVTSGEALHEQLQRIEQP